MHPTEGKVFVLLVSGKVKEGQGPTLASCFQKLATYVEANEPGCLSYQLSFSDKDPDAFIIFERYTTAQYLEDTHCKGLSCGRGGPAALPTVLDIVDIVSRFEMARY
eukprot:XP_001693291.1 predicted protein [Chlamydomonas reinhardtii]